VFAKSLLTEITISKLPLSLPAATSSLLTSSIPRLELDCKTRYMCTPGNHFTTVENLLAFWVSEELTKSWRSLSGTVSPLNMIGGRVLPSSSRISGTAHSLKALRISVLLLQLFSSLYSPRNQPGMPCRRYMGLLSRLSANIPVWHFGRLPIPP